MLLLLSFFACTKTEEVDVPPQLKVIVKDTLAKAVSGAKVSLYATFDNWKTQSNRVGDSVLTDTAGIALFKNLNPTIYHIFVSKDQWSNLYGVSSFKDTLKINTLSTINITIQ